jgi:hypothetical protein
LVYLVLASFSRLQWFSDLMVSNDFLTGDDVFQQVLTGVGIFRRIFLLVLVFSGVFDKY